MSKFKSECLPQSPTFTKANTVTAKYIVYMQYCQPRFLHNSGKKKKEKTFF